MLRKILLGLALVLIVAVASEGTKCYTELDYKTENYILKLKLEIYELKAKNSELSNIIEQMQLQKSDVKINKKDREKAIAKFRKELKLRKDM